MILLTTQIVRTATYFMLPSLIIVPDLHIGYVRLAFALSIIHESNEGWVEPGGEWHNPCPATHRACDPGAKSVTVTYPAKRRQLAARWEFG